MAGYFPRCVVFKALSNFLPAFARYAKGGWSGPGKHAIPNTFINSGHLIIFLCKSADRKGLQRGSRIPNIKYRNV